MYNNLYRFVNIYNENIKTMILIEKIKIYPYIYQKNNEMRKFFDDDDIKI